MNPSTTTPDPEVLRKIAEEFQPAPSRIPFHTLKPYHEFIVMLRTKRASYRSVAELLEKQGVKTSVARVAEYGRIVLGGGKRRKRRKYVQRHTDGNSSCATRTATSATDQRAHFIPADLKTRARAAHRPDQIAGWHDCR